MASGGKELLMTHPGRKTLDLPILALALLVILAQRYAYPYQGQVSEWFKEHAWKACVLETVPWVRIPPCPPPRLKSWRPASLFIQATIPPSKLFASFK